MKKYNAIIFDLDGVIASTDNCHYEAWQMLADEEGIYFDRKINERLRGVSRMECLEIMLEKATKTYSDEQKLEMATRKNNYYKKKLENVDESALLSGAVDFVNKAKSLGIKTAIGSSSKNTILILTVTKSIDLFDAIADGNDITHSKPHPEVFLKAAEKLGIEPKDCLVVEDADAGVEAAIAAGMDVLAVGYAKVNPKATYSADGLDTAGFIFE